MGTSRQATPRDGGLFARVLVGLIGTAAILFALWAFSGQPDVWNLIAPKPASEAQAQRAGLIDDSGLPVDERRSWSCVYLPTANANRHDDVECFDGKVRFRPELLIDDHIISEPEMRTAAERHEKHLNDGGDPTSADARR